jgi:hypothetical protein
VPVRATYNDYGSVDSITPGLTSRVFFQSFDLDVIEKGVGDNQCHDVQVRKGMAQGEWLKALGEGRVFVDNDTDSMVTVERDEAFPGMGSKSWVAEELPEGIPTLSRVEAVLKRGKFPLGTDYSDAGLVVSGVTYGFVRVRGGLGQKTKTLANLVPVLQEAGYAAMLTCGTGKYANEAEVLVAPLPVPKGAKHHIFSEGLAPQEPKAFRPVSQAMIREDVWQILCGASFKEYGGTVSVEHFKKLAAKGIAAEVKFRKQQLSKLSPEEKTELRRERYYARILTNYDNLLSSFLHPSEGVSGFSLKDAWILALRLFKTPEEMEVFAADLAETLVAQHHYSLLRGQWHPSTAGSQSGEWARHKAFLRKLLAIKGRT